MSEVRKPALLELCEGFHNATIHVVEAYGLALSAITEERDRAMAMLGQVSAGMQARIEENGKLRARVEELEAGVAELKEKMEARLADDGDDGPEDTRG